MTSACVDYSPPLLCNRHTCTHTQRLEESEGKEMWKRQVLETQHPLEITTSQVCCKIRWGPLREGTLPTTLNSLKELLSGVQILSNMSGFQIVSWSSLEVYRVILFLKEELSNSEQIAPEDRMHQFTNSWAGLL